MSTSADPSPVRAQDDLFRHVNSHWLDTAEIPEDRASFGAFEELRDEAERAVREIIEQAAADPDATGPARLIGDLYRSFMDVDAVEAGWAAPLTARLAEIEALSRVSELPAVVGRFERAGVGGIFGSYVDTDPGQPDRYTVELMQGGLGLPDESYYREDQYAAIRTAYVRHLETLLGLAGVAEAGAVATRVMALETELAALHWDNVKSRDRTLTYNPMDAAALEQLMPAEFWRGWTDGLGASSTILDHTVVSQPSFFRVWPRC